MEPKVTISVSVPLSLAPKIANELRNLILGNTLSEPLKNVLFEMHAQLTKKAPPQF